MKKLYYLIFIGFTFNVVLSQEIPDAVRYAQDNLNGTARFRAMGGACILRQKLFCVLHKPFLAGNWPCFPTW